MKIRVTRFLLGILGSSLFLQSCTSAKNRFTTWRNLQEAKYIDQAMWVSEHLYDNRRLSYIKANYKNTLSTEKFAFLTELQNYLIDVRADFVAVDLRISTYGSKVLTKRVLDKMNYKRFSINWLQQRLSGYTPRLLRKIPQKYITDTTAWHRRYIKQLPPEQQKNPPSFAEFYFEEISREEALVVLSALRLGIFQEVLEIQEKILKE